ANRFVLSAEDDQKEAVPVVATSVVGVQFKRAYILTLGTCPVPTVIPQCVGQRGMSFRQAVVNFQCLVRGSNGFWVGLLGRHHTVEGQDIVGISQPGVRQSVAGIFFA